MHTFSYKGKQITAISDTHGKHGLLRLPPCDVLIHLGDACDAGNDEELRDFFAWFNMQNAQHKIFVAGNHDLPFDLFPEGAAKMLPENVLFMENSIVEIDDLVIASVKAVPWMQEIVEIDEPVDLLLSHGAPLGILDEGLGCPALKSLIDKCRPKYALFGHVHQATYASIRYNETECVNVCSCDLLRKS